LPYGKEVDQMSIDPTSGFPESLRDEDIETWRASDIHDQSTQSSDIDNPDIEGPPFTGPIVDDPDIEKLPLTDGDNDGIDNPDIEEPQFPDP
jgi:hypothetical protein